MILTYDIHYSYKDAEVLQLMSSLKAYPDGITNANRIYSCEGYE